MTSNRPKVDFLYHANRLWALANGDLVRAETVEDARRVVEQLHTVMLDLEYDLSVWEVAEEEAMHAQPAHDTGIPTA